MQVLARMPEKDERYRQGKTGLRTVLREVRSRTQKKPR
jgi:hypothetical protein